ncbi:hypothetical protein [Actinomycetospora sp. TBRC 11914]|uniref:WXG100-like domain-containing protein n=1 Tax=Actinomycetospora sp. TBRC 11914 TaxID=2729387 RepID=UPI00145D3A58|nr:hypothetical protein [Actinomycetospora sp. TBRC 11914]NMO88666.1 hypothetical protein [Actinomycetospora sp. TBRC 11914]
MTGAASRVASTIGLWWPAADEARLREAADVWDRLAGAVDAASAAGRDAAGRTTTAGWGGDAAATAAEAWGRQDGALGGEAADARRLAGTLREYAGAVEDAKRQIEDLVAVAGGLLVAGGVAAIVTGGLTEVAAAAVTAELVSAAAAVGVELSATVAGIAGSALTVAAFGAGESVLGDVTTQGIREGVFDGSGFSFSELGASAGGGALLGGVGGGVMGGVAVGPIARTAAGDLSALRAPGGRIRAVLDPPNVGAQGGRFAPGVHELPGARAFQAHERPTAELLASEGKSVHARAEVNARDVKNPDALVRAGRDDPGTYTEFKRPRKPTNTAVKDEIRRAAKQLDQYGGGDLVLDGRASGLTREAAEKGLRRALGEARTHGSVLPSRIRIVLADGSSIHHP